MLPVHPSFHLPPAQSVGWHCPLESERTRFLKAKSQSLNKVALVRKRRNGSHHRAHITKHRLVGCRLPRALSRLSRLCCDVCLLSTVGCKFSLIVLVRPPRHGMVAAAGASSARFARGLTDCRLLMLLCTASRACLALATDCASVASVSADTWILVRTSWLDAPTCALCSTFRDQTIQM